MWLPSCSCGLDLPVLSGDAVRRGCLAEGPLDPWRICFAGKISGGHGH